MSLFDAPSTKRRWLGSLALVPVERVCPFGHGPLIEYRQWQGALFVHGGYGATKRTTWLECSNRECRYTRDSETIEVNPRFDR